MQEFLKIAGIFFLVIVFLAIAAIFIIRRQLRKLIRSLGEMEPIQTPTSIHLASCSSPEYKDKDKITDASTEFARRGFQKLGAFKISEMPGVFLEAHVDSDRNLYGIVYEHPSVGVFCDVCLYYTDGGSLTSSNMPLGGQLDERPGHRKIHVKEATVATLIENIEKNKEERAVHPVTTETFVADFEKAYADEMEWRVTKGGPTEEEIRRVAAHMEKSFSAEQIAAATETLAAQAASQLAEICLDHYLQESGMSAVEWENIRDRAVVIHEKMDVKSALTCFCDFTVLPSKTVEHHVKECSVLSLAPRKAFERVNSEISQEKRFTKLGEVTSPAGADIYLAPEL